MINHVIPSFTSINAFGAAGIAIVFILLCSLVPEPARQRFNALMIAGAGAAYLSGGFGGWEFVFCSLMTGVAFMGYTRYSFIAVGWLLHTGWDILHHLYGNPIVPFSPSSSAGCAVCDSILAVWFFFKAPSLFTLFRKSTITPSKVL